MYYCSFILELAVCETSALNKVQLDSGIKQQICVVPVIQYIFQTGKLIRWWECNIVTTEQKHPFSIDNVVFADKDQQLL